MIHTCTQGAKFKRLVRRLRLMLPQGLPITVESVAVGLLERLWHATATNTPRGDIGKLEDADIAEAIGWLGDEAEIVAILVEQRWIDSHPIHRYVVHDWPEHAPSYVKGNVTRMGGWAQNEANCAGLYDRPIGPSYRPVPKDGPIATVLPNLTKPNLTKPNTPVGPLSGDTTILAEPESSSVRPTPLKPVKQRQRPPRVTIEQLSIPAVLDTPEVREAVGDWLEYKRFSYRNPKYLDRALSDFARDGPDGIIQAISMAIAAQWDGFWFPDRKRPSATAAESNTLDFSVTEEDFA